MKCPKCGSGKIIEQGTVLVRTPVDLWLTNLPLRYGEQEYVRDTYVPDCYWCEDCTSEFPIPDIPDNLTNGGSNNG